MKLYGTYQASSKGFGFLIPEDGTSREDDWFVPPRSDGGAWNGDKVAAVSVEDQRGGQRRTAKITAVIERTNKVVTGAIEKQGREIWLRPGSDRLPHPIKLVGRTRSAKVGDKVAVAVTSYGGKTLPPTGTLKQIFGRDGTRQAAVEAILYNYGIERAFPAPVNAAAELAPQKVDDAACAKRLDLRGKTIITIDGDSSKDFDDAVSLERNDQGQWVLGVHIADVTHYVTQGSPLDLEAFHRGTSVYFADQVVPMLPQALSNGICSLNPHVDRLALSCIMTLSKDGAMLDHTIAKTVIRSTERMTYSNCNTLLAGLDPALEKQYAHILPMLKDMEALAAAFQKRRTLRGALALESKECYVICDELGDPVDVQVRETGVSEALIESFMLAANECVAEHLFQLHQPAVYRIHEKPSEDKTTTLRNMLAPLGYELRESDNFALQKVLEQAKGTPQAPAIHMMVLRSLMKARYDVENLGHFGLAAKFYCHFTSPIRRYPDLMVHRILSALLDGRLTERNQGRLTAAAQQAAVQSSEREVAAMSAEREIEKCYLAEYMHGYLGEQFTGAVAGVTRFGLFVALPNGVEGLLPVTALPDDEYEYDEVHMTLTGRRTKAVYSFAMPLEVICAAANPGSGQIDFLLPGVENTAPRAAVRDKKAPVEGRQKRPARQGSKAGYRTPKQGKGRKKR